MNDDDWVEYLEAAFEIALTSDKPVVIEALRKLVVTMRIAHYDEVEEKMVKYRSSPSRVHINRLHKLRNKLEEDGKLESIKGVEPRTELRNLKEKVRRRKKSNNDINE